MCLNLYYNIYLLAAVISQDLLPSFLCRRDTEWFASYRSDMIRDCVFASIMNNKEKDGTREDERGIEINAKLDETCVTIWIYQTNRRAAIERRIAHMYVYTRAYLYAS